MPTNPEQRVTIAGLGAIGRSIAQRLDNGIPGWRLAGVASRDAAKAQAFLSTLKYPVPLVPMTALAAEADIVIECAPARLLAEIAQPVLQAGKRLIVLSAGALLDNPQLEKLAESHATQIMVPTGALIGLDALTAAAEGHIESVRLVTRKPVAGLLGAPYLVQNNIDIAGIQAPLRLFAGSAREAARGFPANLNVAVALSLAGIGADRTQVEIWADPAATRNTHHIEVESDSARFSMTIENIPSENPRTGRITALSVIALLRKLSAPLRVGT
jgi:aspartate dehydrogenase